MNKSNLRSVVFLICALFLISCGKKKADFLVINGSIYTVNEGFDVVEAFAVKDGKIIAVGTTDEIQSKFESEEIINAEGNPVYPGFIDGHAHFFGYGESLQVADLFGTQSWNELIERLKDFAKTHPEGWLQGRGWDQNLWKGKQFPTNQLLNELFPDRPVLLTRVDGHAAIANQKALELAGITGYKQMVGGEMITQNGKLTGVLIDNAIGLVASKIPAGDLDFTKKILMEAQANCFAVGLTTIVDCGIDHEQVELLKKLHESNDLKMRLYAMLSDSPKNYDFLIKNGAIKTERLNVRSFKVYADGALGSRGACLLHPYSDSPNQSGFLLSDLKHFEEVAELINKNNFQMNTHAIGDSANRAILNIYNKVLNGKNDKRWRIEHAQVVNKDDFDKFGTASIIPSVQPTHATSDMYWAEERLGAERIGGAYAYKDLLKQNGWLTLGTDFPVEQINPMLTFYAATIRKDAKGFPEQGFQINNALTPEEALKGMTIWAAKANFEEKEKGSLEVGKFADFVIMDKDFMKAKANEILNVKVLKTYLNGEKVFERK
ncbi:amidohydrolase [Pedobacter flavus]|uniref:Amidohydrolase n=1 Tax=Pedobacter flavus TaxID=3113906 RepID=A0ABU7GYG8_9SPHI|nr:amidohydrolase [Pedobacter sp. VNH31]MEE1884064.1 amidohydrolase [Pedobacter sp. VNH31]